MPITNRRNAQAKDAGLSFGSGMELQNGSSIPFGSHDVMTRHWFILVSYGVRVLGILNNVSIDLGRDEEEKH